MSKSVYKISFDYDYAFADIVESLNDADSLDLSADSLDKLTNFKYDWLKDESDVMPDLVIIVSTFIGGIKNAATLIAHKYTTLKLTPIVIGDIDCYVFSNIQEYSNCINMRSSKISRFSNGDIMNFDSVVLLPNEYAPIFRLEEIPLAYFCTSDFKDYLLCNEFKGWKFEECQIKSKFWF